VNYIICCDRQPTLVQWYCTDRDEDREPIGIVNGADPFEPPGSGYWMTTYRVTATQVWTATPPLDERALQAVEVFGSLDEAVRLFPDRKGSVGAAETATVVYKNTALALLIAEHGSDELIWQRVERQATLRLMDWIKGDEDGALIRALGVRTVAA
jgi:hypothetical protein